jgi:hypothetical protein
LIRIVVKQAIFEVVAKNIFNSDLISLIEMVIFIILILIICKKLNIKLSIFPDIKSKKDKVGYVFVFCNSKFLTFAKVFPQALVGNFYVNLTA